MTKVEQRAMEREAGLFALLLLMPKQFFEKDMEKGMDLGDGKAILELCKKYEVSATAVAARISIYEKHGM